MEPRIQYARTADGVSIAYATMGDGEPFVYMVLGQWSHTRLEWEHPEYRRWFERLAEKRMVVRYDGRGSGLSDREVTDYSLDAHLLDLEAVVNRLGLEKFALFTLGGIGPVGIAYAAGHPERVSHLILFATWARASDYIGKAPLQGMLDLMDKDWHMFTENAAHSFLGWSEGRQAQWFAALLRETTTPEAMRAVREEAERFDVAELLPRIRMPTLVLHRRQLVASDIAVDKGLASRIPDARLVVVEGESIWPTVGDSEPMLRAIDEFLAESEDAQMPGAAPSGLVTILFTDIEGSTTLTQRLGDAKAQEVLRTHNTIVRDALKANAGTEVKHTGDGIMASFPAASQALQCAIAIQQAVQARNRDVGAALAPPQGAATSAPSAAFRVRIGLNAGEPVAEEQDLFGSAVQLARRVCDHADAGRILVSDVVRQLAIGKGFLFSDRGDVALRGFEDPVSLYEVRWRE